jgi:hypothetical protein
MSLVKEFGKVCVRAHDFAVDFVQDFGPEPLPNSIADREMGDLSNTGTDGRPWSRQVVGSAYSIANAIFIVAAGQYLRSLGILLCQDDAALFGFQAVTRSLVEAAARAWWILQSDISARERVIRGRIERFDSIVERDKFLRAGDPNLATVSDSQISFRAKTAALGIEETQDQNGNFLRFERVIRPNNITAVTTFLADRGEPDPEKWYRYYSGIAHSAIFASTSNLEAVLDEATGYYRYEPRLPLADYFDAVRVAQGSFLAVVARNAMLFGHDHEPLFRESERLDQVLISLSMD